MAKCGVLRSLSFRKQRGKWKVLMQAHKSSLLIDQGVDILCVCKRPM